MIRAALILCLLSACGPGLKLTRIEATHRRPANIAVYFSVETRDGEPVADLIASDFNIYEDDKLVSVDESRQTIVNPEVAAAHYTVLLVDMSASVTESDKLDLIVRASTDFVAEVENYQRVAVYAFDGSSKIHPVMAFTKSGQRTSEGLMKLADFKTKDPSTNLHGAIVQALTILDGSLKRAKAPLKFGTLVVFTDGTDRAARVSQQEMLDAIEGSDHSLFAIGVGNEIDDATLSRIGESGYIRVEDSSSVADAFKEIGERIVGFTRRYYLLSYCSPARAGQHQVTVEAVSDDAKGSLSYEFDAKRFSADCDPNVPPPFDTSGRTARSRRKLREAQQGEAEGTVEVGK